MWRNADGLRRSYWGRWVVRLTDTLVEASLPVPPSRLGPIGVARVDRGAKGSEGEIGAAIGVPRKWVSFFRPTTPALSAATISKVVVKPAAPGETERMTGS